VRDALGANPGRIRDATHELARRFPLVTASREVARNVEFEGVQLKEGEMIVAPTVLHGLDEHENPEPFTLDFKRAGARHSTFGSGSHTCPGAHLARTETRIMLEEWLPRIPQFSVPDDFTVRYTGGIVGSVTSLELCWNPSLTNSMS
jgi:camphor 5-monooxygenase